MGTLALGLSSAVCWGVSDFLAGQQSRRFATVFVLAVSQLTGLALFAATLLLLGPSGSAGDVALIAGLAGLTGVLGLGAFYRALAKGTMSLVAPIVATGGALPLLVGVISGEPLGPVGAIGVVIAFAGITLAAHGTGDGRRRSDRTPLIVFALAGAAALAIGASLALFAQGADHGVILTLVFARGVSGTVALLALLAMWPTDVARGRSILPVVAVGALEALAMGLFTLATARGLVSLTAAAASLYPVVTVLLARMVLRERLAGFQAWGAAAALTGVVLMATG